MKRLLWILALAALIWAPAGALAAGEPFVLTLSDSALLVSGQGQAVTQPGEYDYIERLGDGIFAAICLGKASAPPGSSARTASRPWSGPSRTYTRRTGKYTPWRTAWWGCWTSSCSGRFPPPIPNWSTTGNRGIWPCPPTPTTPGPTGFTMWMSRASSGPRAFACNTACPALARD